MKALERYVKKNSKDQPYGKSKSKGKWEGSKGPQMDDQYAESEGKGVVEDSTDSSEAEPTGGMKGYESVKGYGAKKKKQRSYLSEE